MKALMGYREGYREHGQTGVGNQTVSKADSKFSSGYKKEHASESNKAEPKMKKTARELNEEHTISHR